MVSPSAPSRQTNSLPKMKGVILAGGLVAALPAHQDHQQAPAAVYDRPMIKYPIQTLVNARMTTS